MYIYFGLLTLINTRKPLSYSRFLDTKYNNLVVELALFSLLFRLCYWFVLRVNILCWIRFLWKYSIMSTKYTGEICFLNLFSIFFIICSLLICGRFVLNWLHHLLSLDCYNSKTYLSNFKRIK